MDLIAIGADISNLQKAIAIFIVTLSVAIWQSRGWGIAFAALGGAILALATGVVKLEDISQTWEMAGDTSLTLLSLIIISLIVDESGFYRWLAIYLAPLGTGKGRDIFLLVLLLGAAVSTVLGNYINVLIWTPIVIEILVRLKFTPKATLAFVIASGFMAEAASLILPSSNLVNAIASDYFNIPFWRYVLVMMPCSIVAIATSLFVLWFYFGRYIPNVYNFKINLPDARQVIRDRLVFRCSFVVLGLLIIGYLFAQPFGIPAALITAIGAFFMVAVSGGWFHPQGKSAIDLGKIVREAPWQIVLFILGMYLVAIGLRDAGLTQYISVILENLSGWGITLAAMGVSFLAALLSSLMNNLPTVLINAVAIPDPVKVQPAIREAMVYANIIGCNLGAKITPIGSIATLLWLNVLSRKGFPISLAQYIYINFVFTLPVLFVTVLVLVIWLPWLIV